MKLSAVVITLNEEKNIARCIQSLLPLVDEIIILDSGSTDNTQKIATQFPKVRWFQHPFQGYGAQKNYAHTLAQGAYILSVDADEEISPELAHQIAQEKAQWQAEIYFLPRQAFYLGRLVTASHWKVEFLPRLFKKGIAHWDDAPLHEKLLFPPNAQTKTLSGILYHHAYESLEKHWQKVWHYAHLAAQRMYEKKKKPSFLRALLKPPYKWLIYMVYHKAYKLGYRGWAISGLSALSYLLQEILLKKRYEENGAS
ncbi:MAG: glycosyltransferase family 2 protein [Bacteroidia bacterium]